MIIQRKGEPTLDTDIDYYQESEVYTGRENPLKIFIERRILFSCSFDKIKYYPFGKQKCSVMFQLIGADNHITTKVQKEAPVVGQYVIDDWIGKDPYISFPVKDFLSKFYLIQNKNALFLFLKKLFKTSVSSSSFLKSHRIL